MQSKIQELTDKIYQEGINKAREDAELIINDAKEKAASIEKEARENALQITTAAREEAKAINNHVTSELKMAFNQAIIALKQELENLVTLKAVQPGVNELFSDAAFLKSIIIKVLENTQLANGMGARVLLAGKDIEEMERYFKNQVAKELGKEVVIMVGEGVKSGFKVGPSDGSYVISFTEQDLVNLFKTYLRPKARSLLFEGKN